MDSIFGMGNLKNNNIPADCKKNVSMAENSGWKCTITDCSAYGKWYCPFTGW